MAAYGMGVSAFGVVPMAGSPAVNLLSPTVNRTGYVRISNVRSAYIGIIVKGGLSDTVG